MSVPIEYYFNHCAAQRCTRKPDAAGKDRLVIRLILKRVSGTVPPTGDNFIIETNTLVTEKEIWVDFCRIKQFSSDASIESEYTETMAESLSSIGAPEAEHAAIIESIFVEVDTAVSPELTLDVAIWDVTCHSLNLVDGCKPNITPADNSSIEGLERVELQHDDLRQTCAICLVDFAAQDQDQLVLTRLACSHLYHLDCIVQCLEINHRKLMYDAGMLLLLAKRCQEVPRGAKRCLLMFLNITASCLSSFLIIKSLLLK